MIRLALLGAGALSSAFVGIWQKKMQTDFEICGLFTRSPEKTEGNPVFAGIPVCGDVSALLDTKPDYVLEFAGGDAVRQYGQQILAAGVDFVPVSIGALADQVLFDTLRMTARRHHARMYLPSGAIGGFDVLRTFALEGNTAISVENFKAPQSLNGAPGLKGQKLSSTEEACAFSGSARDAIRSFPQNVNVGIAAALAAGNLEEGQVIINSVPGMTDNLHIIRAENSLGRVELQFASSPDPANPKTSTLTAWSVAALLINLQNEVQFF